MPRRPPSTLKVEISAWGAAQLELIDGGDGIVGLHGDAGPLLFAQRRDVARLLFPDPVAGKAAARFATTAVYVSDTVRLAAAAERRAGLA